MPKKGKKGKKDKKGKKGEKKTKKPESMTAIVAANVQVWEARIEKCDRAKDEYRENAKKLMLENDALQTQLMTTERDTIDVITYLKKQDHDKDAQLERFQSQIQDMHNDHRQEKDSVVQHFSKQINDLEDKLGEKMREVEIMQSELKMVKEFRRKRGLMQKELDEIKESMHNASQQHTATLARMEQKFFEEKMRLQQEANQKIAELAEKAHTEAIANLDETTKSVYKENVRLTEALNYHMKEGELLKKERERLSEENEALLEEKTNNSAMVQDRVVQAKQQKELIQELQSKVRTLEKSLSHVVKEFETERKLIVDNAHIESEAAKVELAKLLRVSEMKTKEMTKVKRLARNILDQRTELEQQFVESLDQVKKEIVMTEAQQRHNAQAMFQRKMLTDHPDSAVQTFHHPPSGADKGSKPHLYGVTGKVDIGDFTWEQRECVLRYLFARMNASNHQSEQRKQTKLPPIAAERGKEPEEMDSQTFLTQARLDIELAEMAQASLHALSESAPTTLQAHES